MKHIKTYENKTYKRKKPRIGDYVICTDFTRIKHMEKEFIENTIGQLVDIDRTVANPYTVYYENAPVILSEYAFLTYDDKTKLNNCRWFNREEILFFSPDKEECEVYFATKKYNL